MLRMTSLALILSLGVMAAPAFAAAPECAADAPLSVRVDAALAKPDRPDKQRERDEARRPEVEFLIAHVKPGDHVLDLGAGGGYSSMVLSSAVCDGSVDSHDPEDWDVKFNALPGRQAMAAARPNIHLVQADFDKIPVPATPYDVIFLGMIYHDTFNFDGHDSAKVLGSLKAALKPGGIVVLTDHNTAPGVGSTATNTLHRIEKQTVLDDFKAAGFELVEDSPVLSNSTDDHSKNVFDPSVRGHTDRFALVFRKP
ncbi:MAG: class I SAM-dependent methyltransferase [Asticcacaulis sp.]|nr:class I SAM-dependent methyltransferase [Asticcacaulis sp.]